MIEGNRYYILGWFPSGGLYATHNATHLKMAGVGIYPICKSRFREEFMVTCTTLRCVDKLSPDIQYWDDTCRPKG